MVNEKILEYFREGQKRGFGLEVLKQKLREANFPEQPIAEAEAIIRNENIQTNAINVATAQPTVPAQIQPFPPQSYSSPSFSQVGTEKKGVAWMKIAGIIGIITLVLMIGLFVYALISNPGEKISSSVSMQPGDLSSNEGASSSGLIPLIIISVFFILQIIYYLGFAKMGRVLQLGSLSFGAWAMIIFLVLLPAVSIFAFIYLQSVMQSFVQSALASGLASAGLGDASGLTPTEPTFDKTTGYFLIGAYLFLFVLYLAIQIVLGIGLLKASKEVRFAKVAGIFRFVYFMLIMTGIGLMVYLVMQIISNPLIILTIIMNFAKYKTLILVAQIVSALVILGIVLFESLALFDASKKYE
jgi:hypothetical protein